MRRLDGHHAAHRRIVQVTHATDLIGDLRWKPRARPGRVVTFVRDALSCIKRLSAECGRYQSSSRGNARHACSYVSITLLMKLLLTDHSTPGKRGRSSERMTRS